MKILIESDETGRILKEDAASWLRAFGHKVTTGPDDCEYPETARRAAKLVARGTFDRGILICGTGMGMAMAANKVCGIYAGVCRTVEDARELAASKGGQVIALGRKHNIGVAALAIILAYLETPLGDRPNARRMRELEAQQ